MDRRSTRFIFGLKAHWVLALVALLLISCAKRESVADREAEINRRVQERIEAEHRADEKQKLAERESELAAREKALAAQESSFASLAATLAAEKTPAPVEANQQAEGDASAPTGALADSTVSGPLYPDQYGYVAPTESYIPTPEPTYASYDPYFFASTVPLVTVISRNNRFFYCRPSFRGGPGRNHSGFPAGGVCRPVIRQPVIARTNPPPRVATRPTALPVTQQVITRSSSIRRPGTMVRPAVR